VGRLIHFSNARKTHDSFFFSFFNVTPWVLILGYWLVYFRLRLCLFILTVNQHFVMLNIRQMFLPTKKILSSYVKHCTFLRPFYNQDVSLTRRDSDIRVDWNSNPLQWLPIFGLIFPSVLCFDSFSQNQTVYMSRWAVIRHNGER